MRILDLGCGFAKTKDAIGLDRAPLVGVDVMADLAQFPYPFAADCFDAIYLNDVIEHLPDTIAVMEELYRVCAPEARVYIRVINWNSQYNAMDPTHVRLFHEHTFNFFGTFKDRAYYSTARFDVVKVNKGYSARAKKLFRDNVKWMEWASFYLNNVLEDLNFELKAVKPAGSMPIAATSATDFWPILRCPHCVAGRTRRPGADPGRLSRINDGWLACVEPDCGRNYPVYDGLPVFFRDLADEYRGKPSHALPVSPPGNFARITAG